MRGATPCSGISSQAARDFNPRTPCGVRPGDNGQQLSRAVFQSTHPLRGATLRNGIMLRAINFNPRTPCGVRRARCCTAWPMDIDFNPRTPCGVRHHTTPRHAMPSRDFNPRTPCGVRRPAPISTPTRAAFQSTHPLRGATRERTKAVVQELHFNPRTPCGVRLARTSATRSTMAISIHAPLAGCDRG